MQNYKLLQQHRDWFPAVLCEEQARSTEHDEAARKGTASGCAETNPALVPAVPGLAVRAGLDKPGELRGSWASSKATVPVPLCPSATILGIRAPTVSDTQPQIQLG